MTSFVEISERDNYTLITMDDGKANALGFAMIEQLNAAFDTAEAGGKVIVLAGRPGKFSAGFDLNVMSRFDDDTTRLLTAGSDLAMRLHRFPVPVIGAVSGHALAMGALLCLSIDYRIGMSGDFKLGLNEVAIGMTLPWFGIELARSRLAPHWLTRAVDLATLFAPDTAAEVGYLDEFVAPEQLLDRAAEVAAQFAKLDMTAFRETKARTRDVATLALERARERDFA